MKRIFFLTAVLALSWLAACVSTPVTNRPALVLIPFSQEVSLGAQSFQEILKKEKESRDPRLKAVVRRVTMRIARVSSMPNLDWDARLFESDEMNAFALPGGKVAVYTGILPVCRNEAGLATVLGHEIGHVVARHGAQRITQNMLVSTALLGASISLATHKNRDLFLGALGLGALYGITLPYSRSQEAEADRIGLDYMAWAGYDPREALRFWKRFAAQQHGPQIPEFMSTHPADATRIAKIESLLPGAVNQYGFAKEKHGLGETLVTTPPVPASTPK